MAQTFHSVSNWTFDQNSSIGMRLVVGKFAQTSFLPTHIENRLYDVESRRGYKDEDIGNFQ
jgi:hypothetical protein